MKYGDAEKAIDLFEGGGVGVSLFFIISGYVILMSLEKKNLIEFIISRISRLYPAYVFGVLTTSIAILFFGSWYAQVDFINFLKNLTMFQYYLGGSNIDGVYWSLRVEVAFYIGIACLFFAIPRRYFWLVVASITFLACLVNGLVNIIEIPLFFDVIRKIAILEFIPFFSLGMLIYYKSDRSDFNYGEKGFSFLVFVILAAVCFDLLCNKDTGKGIFLILMSGIMFIFSNQKLAGLMKVFELNFLVYIGRISYSIYLLHQVIGYLLIHFFISLGIDLYISIVVAFAVILLLSHFSYILIESNLSARFHKKLLFYAGR
tara:strand:- start:714 stop:1664 length:951 start_codon:yes stop_codon:yes gene_type:complete